MSAATDCSGKSRICSTCFQQHPEDQFRLRSIQTGARMRQCRSCHASYERERRLRIQHTRRGLTAQKLASRVSRSKSFEQAASIVCLLTRSLGGPERMLEFWVDEIERLKARRRFSPRLTRFFEMLFHSENLREAREAERRRNYDNPEWVDSLREEIQYLVRNHPEVLLQAAEE